MRWLSSLSPTPPRPETNPPRLLLYCASNIGLGHLMRLLRVTRRLTELRSETKVLLITDRAEAARAAGAKAELCELPAFEFVEESGFGQRPAASDFPPARLREERARRIAAAAKAFAPHVVLMDTLPHGKLNELAPTLWRWARQRRPPVRVLQLRDIPFPPGESHRWTRPGHMPAAETALYDYVFLAGDVKFFDVSADAPWARALGDRFAYAGFVVPSLAARRREPDHVVASFGGGWEAAWLTERVVGAFDRWKARRSGLGRLSIYTGPAIARSAFERLSRSLQARSDVRLTRFAGDFEAELAACGLAILQAGSTPFQILESDIPMIVYHRDYSSREQQVRAERLAAWPGVRVIDRPWLESQDVASLMSELTEHPPNPRRTGLDFGGVERVAAAIERLLVGGRDQLPPASALLNPAEAPSNLNAQGPLEGEPR